MTFSLSLQETSQSISYHSSILLLLTAKYAGRMAAVAAGAVRLCRGLKAASTALIAAGLGVLFLL